MINLVNACFNNPCLNGASCQVTGTGNTYTCICLAGYSGVNCQICNFYFISFMLLRILLLHFVFYIHKFYFNNNPSIAVKMKI